MKNFNSIAKTMLSKSKNNAADQVFNKMSNLIQEVLRINGIMDSDVMMNSNDGTINFYKTEDRTVVNTIAEQLAIRAQDYGYLVELTVADDHARVLTITLRPFNMNDFICCSRIEVGDFNEYGCLNVEFMPCNSRCYYIKVNGVFYSGTLFDEFIECFGEDEVYNSDYHYHHNNDIDYVMIEIDSTDIAV